MKDILKNARVALVAGIVLVSGQILSMVDDKLKDLEVVEFKSKETYTVPLSCQTKWSDVYSNISKQIGVPMDQIKFIKNGNIMKNNESLVVGDHWLGAEYLKRSSGSISLLNYSKQKLSKASLFDAAEKKEQD